MRRISFAWIAIVAILLPVILQGAAADGPGRSRRYPMTGMVLKVDPSRTSVLVSHDSVPEVMPAMTMWFDVKEPKDLEGVAPGTIVEFTLTIGPRQAAWAEHLRIRPYASVEQDPSATRRLGLLNTKSEAARATAAKAVPIGQIVPEFTLLDQMRHPVSLSQFRGKVVAVTFIYTSCALPQFCFRMANQFGVLQRRFRAQLGQDLVLLTVTFDPVRDQPERLAEYASQWKADARVWHFLTGAVPDIQRVCALFAVDAFPDEGLMSHTTRSAVIDRRGILIASIDGNQYTAAQLGDLIQATLKE